MPGIVFDTSVIIAYRSPELPKNALMSAVVIQELAAGAADKSILQFWATARRLHEKAGTLLVTENVKDFARIRKFCRVRFVGGREYFS
jgi:predicted nucleic acid-binding protein